MIINSEYFQWVTEGTKPINDGKNRIYYGEVYEYYNTDAFRNFSIKLALQGTALYKTTHQEFKLDSNNFLLTSKQKGSVVIDSPTIVKTLFIDLQRDTIDEAITLLKTGNQFDFDNLEAGYFFSTDFFENIYALKNNPLGRELKKIITAVNSNTINPVEETFLELAEKLVLHELDHYKSLGHLRSVRASTKKELLRRLLQGKEFIDEHFLKNPGIAEIVKHCNMSPFHFFRSFKQAFGCSPYQYIITKRLEYAQSLIRTEHSFTSIAVQCGFADLFSFSKAFKKMYGISPSAYKTRKPQVFVA